MNNALPSLDVQIRASVADETRRFELDVDFSTTARFAALYGPSGAGKTLTLQAIAGLLRPTAGRVQIAGDVLLDTAQRIDVPVQDRRIGYLFQNYALFPHLTVRQNIEFGLTTWRRRRPSEAQKAKTDELLETFGLAVLADSRPETLSGGQQQRTALARALACEPQLLLLDEPFAALNAMLRGTLRKELAETCRRWAIPTLMITHDVDDILALADVAFVYEQGRIVREVDVRAGRETERVRRDITQQDSPLLNPLHQKVRTLLS